MAEMTHFDEPVTVLVGLGFPRRLQSALEAFALLQDWPLQGPARNVALNACRAAIAGDVDAETARAAVVYFAERLGILLADGWVQDSFAGPTEASYSGSVSSSFATSP